MSNVSEAKAALRRALRAEAARHSAAELTAGSKSICEHVMAQAEWRDANAVLLYMPMADEPDIEPLIRVAVETNKTVVLPRYDARAGTYEACRVTDLREDLVRGQFGIYEPSAKCPGWPLNKLDLVLVPGIGFSLNGCRLGRGRGYFDRILSGIRAWKCGVAFEWQVTVEIPAEQHDIQLNSIVTPTRWHAVRL